MQSPIRIQSEITIACIHETDLSSRLTLVHRLANGEPSFLLKRESFHPTIGWFEQQGLELTREELVALKHSLVHPTPKACQKAASVSSHSAHDMDSSEPILLRFPMDSAHC